ncbi:redoxin family protein [Amycolatopsis sp. NPDC051373]|uniref:redoxin family protein n=1 Tax=Amycolatopsis sp. NPDC051373 TaxID=3155801 RepID=UPI00344DFF2D
MPDGDLLDAHGAATTLTAARAGKPAVVVTYRGAWCPYCNIALRTYQAASSSTPRSPTAA